MLPSSSILISVVIESVLIAVSTVLLAQPDFMFATKSQRARSVAKGSGYLLLCLTFCWSVFVGIVFALNNISIQI